MFAENSIKCYKGVLLHTSRYVKDLKYKQNSVKNTLKRGDLSTLCLRIKHLAKQRIKL